MTRPYYDDGTVTIWHGDCREVDAWDIAGGVMVTDPPYGMAFRSGRDGQFGESVIAGDDTPELRDLILARWGTRPALVFGRWSIPRPAKTRFVLTWEKGTHVGMGDLSMPWKPNTEEIYVLGSGFIGHRGSSVIYVLADAGTVAQKGKGRFHPTQKPIPLLTQLIDKCPPLADVVDPFMGSGSTLVAAKSLGRKAIGVELEERYCEIAAKRCAQGVLSEMWV